MPERDRVLRLRKREHRPRRARAAIFEIECGERVHERLGCVLDIGNPRADRWPDLHHGAKRRARSALPRLEFHVTAGDVQQAVAQRIRLERVRAPQIDRRSSRGWGCRSPRK